jgi:CdvA-like coiled-coil domain
LQIKSGAAVPVHSMQSSEAVGFLGKTVDDLYGRQVGVVVGFSLKTNGDVESVGLDQGSGSFAEVKATRLLFHEQALIVVPMWKADVTRIAGETGVLRKRISALRELERDSKENGSASPVPYEQLRGQYEARVAKTEESSEKLLQEMRNRMQEIDQQDETVARFLVNVNIQFRSGEISDASFGVISDHCAAMKARNGKEREELTTAYGMFARKEEEGRPIELKVPVSG